MKKAISILMCAALVVCSIFAMAGCTKQDSITNDIVLITDGGNIDDGAYNQSAWEGVQSYAADNGMSYRYYQPVLDQDEITVDNVEKYVELAEQGGAQFVIFTGDAFAVSAYELAPSYPDINFLLLDAVPHSQGDTTDRYIKNVMSVTFDALQSGFLAGYIAVLNGNTELGYFGQTFSDDSANYGAGFAQGAAYAADSLGVPVTLDWAEYDSPLLDYNYSFTVTACYEKYDDSREDLFKVNVVNGIGTGVYTDGSNVTITADPAPVGQEFDHWEVKSDTEGVKDKKVNISSKTKSSMNLLVEKCDCTITAVYKDIEGKSYPVKVLGLDNVVYSETSVAENSSCDITTPVAPINMVFDHWECDDEDAVEDVNSASTKVNVTDKEVTVKAVYEVSDIPTYNLVVETGEGGDGESSGSGSYLAGDYVNVAAAVPKDGYMFSHWENKDIYNQSTGIAMENEYYWNTGFEMVDRYASICERMYDNGATMIFNGGNDKGDSAFTAKQIFDYNLGVITAGAKNGNAYTSLVKNYGEAVKDCLEKFEGGSVATANCSSDGIYATFVSDDEKLVEQYDKVYKALADGKISLIAAQGSAGYDFCKAFEENHMSECLTLNDWFLDPIVD